MKPTTIVRLRLPEEMAERLQRCAAASDRPRNQMGRWLLRNALEAYEAAVFSGPIKDEEFAGFLGTVKAEPAHIHAAS